MMKLVFEFDKDVDDLTREWVSSKIEEMFMFESFTEDSVNTITVSLMECGFTADEIDPIELEDGSHAIRFSLTQV